MTFTDIERFAEFIQQKIYIVLDHRLITITLSGSTLQIGSTISQVNLPFPHPGRGSIHVQFSCSLALATASALSWATESDIRLSFAGSFQ
jgi:hypothetical protein